MASAIMIYSNAKGFSEAAKMIYLSPHYGDRHHMLILPIGHLVGFGIELYLKSFLTHHGVDKRRLSSRALGHNLIALYDLALTFGFSLAHRKLLDEFHHHHSAFEFRYADDDTVFHIPSHVETFTAMDALDRYVDGVVGASASHGLQPGH